MQKEQVVADFVALYRGRTVSEAELIALSADDRVVRVMFKELLGEYLQGPKDSREDDPSVVARTILTKRQDAAMERIEAHANSIGSDNPEIAEAAERVKSVRGPDEAHTRVFRLEAIADLVELIDEITAGEKADPLEAKKVPELRAIAKEKGVDNPSELKKPELIQAIRESEKSEDEEG